MAMFSMKWRWPAHLGSFSVEAQRLCYTLQFSQRRMHIVELHPAFAGVRVLGKFSKRVQR